MSEVLPQFSHIYIPANKQSAWVYREGSKPERDTQKEHQGVWVGENDAAQLQSSPVEVWVFFKDRQGNVDVEPTVLENNPLQGKVVYDPECSRRKATPEQMWFYPPGARVPAKYNTAGVWVYPEMKRDMSALGNQSAGFMNVTGKAPKHKGGKLGVGGSWMTFGAQDFVKKKRKTGSDDDSDKSVKWTINIRTPKGVTFPLSVIPGERIEQVKDKVESKKGIPREDQILIFQGSELKDEKTLVGSGVRNGDTLDLGPMHIYVKNFKGRKYTLHVDPEEAIEDVMVMVEEQEGTPVSKQILHFKKTRLLPGNNLLHYKIKHKNTIHLGGMLIFVEPSKGETIQLDVTPRDTIESVKKRVETRIGIPVAEQKLFFNDKELQKNLKTLEFYNIEHLDTLVFGGMRITIVKDWNKQKFTLAVEPKSLIQEVKTMIEKREGIPINKQRLTFKGKSVYNSKTLEQSKIKNRAILHLEGTNMNMKLPDEPEKKKLKKSRSMSPEIVASSKITTASDRKKPPKKTKSMPLKEMKKPDMIKVTTPDGVTRNFIMEPDERVSDLKERISKKIGLPFEQPLLFNDEPLDDDDKLQDRVRPGDILTVAPSVFVDFPEIGKTKLSFLPKHTFEDIKDIIEAKTGIPKSQQRLFFMDEKKELDDDLELSKTKIKNGDALQLKLPKLRVKTADGRKFVFDMEPDESVRDFKKKVAEKVGIPLGQALMFGDEELDDDDKLKDYNLRHGTVLTMPPTVDVDLPGGRTTLAILPRTTIKDLKEKIEEESGIPKHGQRLFFMDEKKELDDDLELSKTKIKEGGVLQLKLPKLRVKTADGRKFVFDMEPDESVRDFKKKVAEKVGIPLGQALVFEDEEWDDDDKLKDYNLRHGTVLTIPPELEIEHPAGKTKLSLGQRMFFDDVELNDDDKLSDHNLRHGNALDVIPEVGIHIPGMNKVLLCILPTHTIGDIKDMIEEKTDVPKSRQRIFYVDSENSELDNSLPVSKTKMKDGVALRMVDTDDNQVGVRGPGCARRQFFMDPEQESEKVDIELPGLGRRELVIFPQHTIKDIKEMVEEETGVKQSNQRIFYFDGDEEKELDDSLPLSKSKLGEGVPLQMRALPPQIKVKAPNGREFFVVIEPEDTVDSMKKKVEEKTGLRFKGQLFNTHLADLDFEDDPLAPETIVDRKHGRVLILEPEDIDIGNFDMKKPKVKGQLFNTHLADLDFEDDPLAPEKIVDRKHGRVLILPEDVDEHVDELPSSDKVGVAVLSTKVVGNINVTIKHWKGHTFALDLDPTEYIDTVKERIQDLQSIPVDQQRLTFEGESVDDTLTLQEQSIVDHSTLVLEPMKVFVILPNGKKKIRMTVELDDKIKKVKRLVSKKAKVEADFQCLLLGAQELEDIQTLSYYDVEHGDVLTMETFQVSVAHWSGDVFTIQNIHPSGTIQDVERIMRENKQISSDDQQQQKFKFEGKLVNSFLTLKDGQIKHKSVLMLEPSGDVDLDVPNMGRVSVNMLSTATFKDVANEDDIWPVMPNWKQRIFFFDNEKSIDSRIEIRVMHWSGDTFTFDDVRWTEKLVDIKKRIKQQKKIPINIYRIKVAGRVLDDKKSLVVQKINHKSVLLMEPLEQKRVDELPSSDKVGVAVLSTKVVGNINVTIKHWKGHTFALDLDPTEYIDTVKERIQDLQSIPVDQQRLTFEGESVDDTLTLQEQSIVDHSTLVLEPMKVFVILPNGKKKIRMTVELDDKIKKVKRLVSKKAKVEADFQCLLLGAQELEDIQTLSYYDVEHGDVLTMETFQVSVAHWSGDVLVIKGVGPDGTMEDVKEKIFEMKQIPKERQQFKFEGKLTNCVTSLKDQKITHKSVLIMEETRNEDAEQKGKEKLNLSLFVASTSKSSVNPKITVRHWKTSSSFTLDIEPTEYIDDVKERIQKVKNIPVDHQRLALNGKPVDDDRTLQEQSIGDGSTLVLEPMRIHVMLPGGKCLIFEVDLDDAIKKIKDLVSKSSRFQVEEQVILLGGEELMDSQTLSECGVEHDDVLNMDTFDITVVHLNGETFTLSGVKPNDSIHDVKNEIFKTKQTPKKDQRFKFEGKLVHETLSLKDQKIRHKAILIMVGDDFKSNEEDDNKSDGSMSQIFATSGHSLGSLSSENDSMSSHYLDNHYSHDEIEAFMASINGPDLEDSASKKIVRPGNANKRKEKSHKEKKSKKVAANDGYDLSIPKPLNSTTSSRGKTKKKKAATGDRSETGSPKPDKSDSSGGTSLRSPHNEKNTKKTRTTSKGSGGKPKPSRSLSPKNKTKKAAK